MNEQSYNNGLINNFNNLDNQMYNGNNINVMNNMNNSDNIPFIQKLVFFLTGLSCGLIALSIWFLFNDNKKYYKQLRIIKNGALVGIIVPLVIFLLYFLLGILTFSIYTS